MTKSNSRFTRILSTVLSIMLVSMLLCFNSAAFAEGEKTKVSIGIGNAYPPFCYVDEDENIAGYDYETLCLVADMLSDKYEFKFTADAFGNLLIGLDTGTYDIAAHHFGYTEQRAENYLYGTVVNMYAGYFLIGYVKGRTDIVDMASLEGKTVATHPGSMAETLILQRLEENPDHQFDIEYIESGNNEVLYSGLMNGLYDAYIATRFDLNTFNAPYDNFMEYTDSHVSEVNSGTLFLYPKGHDELQQDVDAALQTLLDNGKLAEVSIEMLGDDYTHK